MFVHSAEDPAMAMEISELRVFELLVELRRTRLLEKLHIRPRPATGSPFRISGFNFALLGRSRMTLLRGPHVAALDLVVPPGVPKVGRFHVGPWVDVARDALA